MKIHGMMALFLIMLVVTLPISSSSALAVNVRITSNSGEDGIDGFINAKSDVWQVEALISGAELTAPGLVLGTDTTVSADKVIMEVGSGSAQFNSCEDTEEGVLCQYNSPFNIGVTEKSTVFNVNYYPDGLSPIGGAVRDGILTTAGASAVIHADGSPPIVQNLRVDQKEDHVEIFFDVKEKTAVSAKPAIGIKLVEIIDADSNAVLQEIHFEEQGILEYSYADSGFENVLQAVFDGEGKRRVKVRATDWLGHSKESHADIFKTDFVQPVITDFINLSVGKFIGDFNVKTDIKVRIRETSSLQVRAYSEQAELSGHHGSCTLLERLISGQPGFVPGTLPEGLENLWECTWSDVKVFPSEDFSLRVIAEDDTGNVAEQTLTFQFTMDDNKPEIVWFGPERVFDGIGYVRNADGRTKPSIFLVVNEQGVGIDPEDIYVNLQALGGDPLEQGSEEECVQDEFLVCEWEVNTNLQTNVSRISVVKLEDKVGNSADLPEVNVVVDNGAPYVEEIEFFGITGEAKKDYFQSDDQIGLEMKILERSGLMIMVNLNNIVMGAKEEYPKDYVVGGVPHEDGWRVYTQEDCVPLQGALWQCNLLTDNIMSGPHNANLEIIVSDTAGNVATEWVTDQTQNMAFVSLNNGKARYRFDLLGVDTEENPNFWQLHSLDKLKDFIDIDVTQLTLTNMPYKLELRTPNGMVQALDIELASCSPKYEPVEEEVEEEETEASETEETESGWGETSGSPLAGAATGLPEGVFVAETVPELSRVLLWGGKDSEGDPSPEMTMVLEFADFDAREMFNIDEEMGIFEEAWAEYTCQLVIYSKLGTAAMAVAEIEEIDVRVPFGFTELGKRDENLDRVIKEAKNSADGVWKAITILNSILRWLNVLINTINSVMTIFNILSNANAAFTHATEGLGPVSLPARASFCFGVTTFQSYASGIAENTLGKIVRFLSCTPKPTEFMGQWHQQVQQFYNIEIRREIDQSCENAADCSYRQARSVKDNLFLSAMTGCVPGIVKNLDEYRQIMCKKIYCLQEEVPANKATISSCNAIQGRQICKYVIGELWYLIPFANLGDQFFGFLKNAISDPIAGSVNAVILTCGFQCTLGEGGLAHVCAYFHFALKIYEFIDNSANTIISVRDEIQSGGLQYCSRVGL